MISRSSRLLHAALVVVCGAGIVYAPVRAQTSLTLLLGQPGNVVSLINLGHQTPPPGWTSAMAGMTTTMEGPSEPEHQRRPSRSSQVRGCWEGS